MRTAMLVEMQRVAINQIANNHNGDRKGKFAAIVFADMIGFSERSSAPGDDDKAASAEIAANITRALIHNEVGEVIAERLGGEMVKSLGDGIFLQFPKRKPIEAVAEAGSDADADVDAVTVARAVLASILIAQVLSEYNPSLDDASQCLLRPIRTKIGIATGPVIRIPSKSGKEDDLFGEPVNEAARLASLGRANQILVSEEALNRLECRRLSSIPGGLQISLPDFGALLDTTKKVPSVDAIGKSINDALERLKKFTPTRHPTPISFPVIEHENVSLKNMGQASVFEVIYDCPKGATNLLQCSRGRVGSGPYAERMLPVASIDSSSRFADCNVHYIDNERDPSGGVAFLLSGVGLDHNDFIEFLQKTNKRAIAFTALGFAEGSVPSHRIHDYLNSSIEDHIGIISGFIKAKLSDLPGVTPAQVTFIGFSVGATLAILSAEHLKREVKNFVFLDPNTHGYGFITSKFAKLETARLCDIDYVASELNHPSSQDGSPPSQGSGPPMQWQEHIATAEYLVRTIRKFAAIGGFIPVAHMSRLVLNHFSSALQSAVAAYYPRSPSQITDEFHDCFAPLLESLCKNGASFVMTWDGGEKDRLNAVLAEEVIRKRSKVSGKADVRWISGTSHFDMTRHDFISEFLKELEK